MVNGGLAAADPGPEFPPIVTDMPPFAITDPDWPANPLDAEEVESITDPDIAVANAGAAIGIEVERGEMNEGFEPRPAEGP